MQEPGIFCELHDRCELVSIQVLEGLEAIGQKYREMQKEEGAEKQVEHERKTEKAWY